MGRYRVVSMRKGRLPARRDIQDKTGRTTRDGEWGWVGYGYVGGGRG
jgi:hypothetical protein